MASNRQDNRHPPIRATLLGKVQVVVGDRVITDDDWPLRSARSLLLLLLISPGHTVPKDRALDTLWPESSLDVAKNALYKALHALRRTLEPGLNRAKDSAYIESRGSMIAIRSDADLWVDADACEALINEAATADTATKRKLLRQAVNLYGGALLPTEPYEDWPVPRRESVHFAWEGAVLELAALDLDAGEPQASVASLELLLSFDPTIEAAHRALMQGYCATGQRSRALRQYARCVSALKDDLGIDPERETQELHETILAMTPQTPAQPPASAPPTRILPSPPTTIVGRDREAEMIQGTLWRQDVRLVTLTGPGGVGKTRLAIETASRLVEDFVDGVAFVELASIRDPNLVVAHMASTLGLLEEPGLPIAETLREWLQPRDMLLVIDNFEHVLDAAPAIGSILESCPNITVLATSRERLQLRAEHVHEVPPLSTPRADRLPAPSLLARYGSVALFVQHMKRIDPGFEITSENRDVVSNICRHLEGLPLAIELATARARFFSLPALLSRLANRLDIEEGPRDLPGRQRTLRATVAWSHDLLSPVEQTVFRRLGVATGGCNLEAAASLCGSDTPRHLDHIQSLAEKHLLRWEDRDDGPRLIMLETIREYALEQLHESGEAELAREHHARHYLDLAAQANAQLVGLDQLTWFERLTTEQDNIRGALEWALSQQDDQMELGVRAAVALRTYWLRRRSLAEGITWIERAAALRSGLDQVQARALLALASLYEAQSDFDRAEHLIDDALPICRQHDDHEGIAEALNSLGEMATMRGDLLHAYQLHNEALAHHREANLVRESAGSLNNLATVAYYQGDFHRALDRWNEAITIFRDLGDKWATSVLLGNLGSAAMAAGDFDQAVRLHEENLTIARLLNDQGTIGRQLSNLAEAHQLRGDSEADGLLETALELHRKTNDRQSEISTLTFMGNSAKDRCAPERAAQLYAESIAVCKETGDRATLANVALLERIASLAVESGMMEEAAELLAASEKVRNTLGTPLMPYYEPLLVECEQRVSTGLDRYTATEKQTTGRAMSVDEALQKALDVCHLLGARRRIAPNLRQTELLYRLTP